MAKRIGSHDRFGGSLNHKKPKLDVSVQKRNDINYGASTSNSNSKNMFKKPYSLPISENIWNGDDDDDLLIISQIVENKIQSNDIFARNTDGFDNMSITFENFGSHVQSSTQVPILDKFTKTSKPTCNVESSSLFDDSFDFEWEDNLRNEKNNVFRKPLNFINNIDQKIEKVHPKLMSLKNDNFNTSVNDFTGSSVSNERQHDAIEIDKLIKRLDLLQDENKKHLDQINSLSEQINDLNEKVQTKEGEASILRHELRSSKQALDTLRVQKISENDTIRQEYQNKIIDMERVKNVIQAELNQKKIENIQLKQKKAIDGNAIEIIKKYQELSEINKLNFKLETDSKKSESCLPNEIFNTSNVHNYSAIEKYFHNQFEELCSILLQCNHSSNFYKIDSNKIKFSFEDTMQKLIKYLELNLSKCRKLNGNDFEDYDQSYFGCLWCFKKPIKQKNVLDKMNSFRKFTNILCYIIENVPSCKTYILDSIRTTLISTELNFEIVLQLILNSSNIDYHMGILECIGSILTTLAKIENFQENYMKYFNIMSHCVPNLHVMAEISNCIQILSNNKFHLQKMCKKSLKFKISYSANKKIIKIPKSNCILQTFCTILEYKIKEEKYLNQNKFEILRILENYMQLLGNCFKIYPVFMIDPNFNESDLADSNKKTYDINHSICNCYALSCCTFVFLFNKFLTFWTKDQQSFDLDVVKKICKMGSILLCDIFDYHYQPVIGYVGNLNVKRNLILILDCLQKNKKILNSEYENVITSIKNSSVITDTELSIMESQKINQEDGMRIIECEFENAFFL